MEEINKKGGGSCLCNWMKTSWQKTKETEKERCHRGEALDDPGSFSFLRDDAIGFQVEWKQED